MSETTTTAAPAAEVTTTETTTATVATPDVATLEAEVAKWKDLARKHEDHSKANADAAKKLTQLEQQSMSDLEKAVAQARVEGRAEGIAEASAELVAARIEAAAAGRLDDTQLATLLESVNLAGFLDEDGKVDGGKVARFVDGIAPKPDENTPALPPVPDLGQGTRNANPAAPNDPLLRDVQRLAGIN